MIKYEITKLKKIGAKKLPGLESSIRDFSSHLCLWLTVTCLFLCLNPTSHPLTPNKTELTTSGSLSSYCDDVRTEHVVNMEMLINPSIKKVIKTGSSRKGYFKNWAKRKLEQSLSLSGSMVHRLSESPQRCMWKKRIFLACTPNPLNQNPWE